MLISVGTAALLLVRHRCCHRMPREHLARAAWSSSPSPRGRTHYGQKTVSAKPGLIEIFFTNNSSAPHNVSLEHNGEYEFGSTLTIRKGSTVSFLTLAKGTYHVYSSVGRDEDKGMAATLVVK